eukprot:CAMPEP_0176087894 /NCGR_PEP_ID=MMETSP0120_2-20121206/44006_1 /TAXON_ID=160619 /ORGANISM="Kryptoperidinium foliaceum, Strain CCMP 1326" /LENGTH=44 /DNA_ID= /DNA_START= /DNA_END= /DNA_ORIENTATION=
MAARQNRGGCRRPPLQGDIQSMPSAQRRVRVNAVPHAPIAKTYA